MSAAPLRALVRRHGPALSGVLDQAVIGIGNLAVGLLVVHLSSKAGYGVYTLCYMAVVAASSLVNALFAGPVIVGFHRQPDGDGRGFAAGALRAMLWTIAPIGLAVAAGGGLLAPGHWRLPVMLAGLATIGVSVQDFIRGYLFVVRRGFAALVSDGLALALWAGCTVSLTSVGRLPAEVAALAGCAAASAAAAVAILAYTGLVPAHDARMSARDYWRLGRWNLGGATITAAQNQGHVYLAGLIVSTAAVADLNAARMMMAPMAVLVVGANRTLVPALARLLAGGDPGAANRLAGAALAAMLAAVLSYTAALLLTRSTLIPIVLGARYRDVSLLLALWGVVMVMQAIDMNLSALMQAAHRFRELALINLWVAVPTLACVVPMIGWFGVSGNLLVLAGSFFAMNLLMIWKLYGGDAGRRPMSGR